MEEIDFLYSPSPSLKNCEASSGFPPLRGVGEGVGDGRAKPQISRYF